MGIVYTYYLGGIGNNYTYYQGIIGKGIPIT